jgi:hypothetical protein
VSAKGSLRPGSNAKRLTRHTSVAGLMGGGGVQPFRDRATSCARVARASRPGVSGPGAPRRSTARREAERDDRRDQRGLGSSHRDDSRGVRSNCHTGRLELDQAVLARQPMTRFRIMTTSITRTPMMNQRQSKGSLGASTAGQAYDQSNRASGYCRRLLNGRR